MRNVQSHGSRRSICFPENAFLFSFDQAIEVTAKALMKSGMAEEDVWAALAQSVETLKEGIQLINADQFANNFSLGSPLGETDEIEQDSRELLKLSHG